MKLSLPDQLTLLGERYTQAAIAAKFGISTRTIRRWKNQGVAPSQVKRAALPAIAKQAQRERERLRDQGRSIKQQFTVPRQIAVPPKLRRITRVDPKDPQRKRRILSDTVDADVRKLRSSDVSALLKAYRDRGNEEDRRAGFRLVVKMQVQFESGGFVKPAGDKTMTGWEEFNDWSDEEIDEFLEEVYSKGRVYGVRLLDPIQPKKKKMTSKKHGAQKRKPQRSRK